MLRGAILILASLGLAAGASAQHNTQAGSPVVVELFTSQSCYSCPAAEAFLGELAGRDDVLALEWHVDYWNDITYGSAGRWVDPFSSADHTARQVAYNRAIRGIGNVYTPQMVIGGRLEAIGSREGEVEAAIAAAAAAAPAGAVVAISADAAALAITLAGQPAGPADLILVRYLTAHTTEVPRGENHGKVLTNHHVVTVVTVLGRWSGGPAAFTAALPADREGCALLVQAEGQGPILAAARCPLPGA